MSLCVHRGEVAVKALGWPSTHSSSQDSTSFTLPVFPVFIVTLFKIISRTCFKYKKYLHSNVYFFISDELFSGSFKEKKNFLFVITL